MLFASRTEVRCAEDRCANFGTNYLLLRFEGRDRVLMLIRDYISWRNLNTARPMPRFHFLIGCRVSPVTSSEPDFCDSPSPWSPRAPLFPVCASALRAFDALRVASFTTNQANPSPQG